MDDFVMAYYNNDSKILFKYLDINTIVYVHMYLLEIRISFRNTKGLVKLIQLVKRLNSLTYYVKIVPFYHFKHALVVLKDECERIFANSSLEIPVKVDYFIFRVIFN